MIRYGNEGADPTLSQLKGLILSAILCRSFPDTNFGAIRALETEAAALAAAGALEARLRETIAERDALRAQVAELEAPIKCSTGCCCTCTDPCHSRRDYGERCLRCGKHRPPRGRIVWGDDMSEPTLREPIRKLILDAVNGRVPVADPFLCDAAIHATRVALAAADALTAERDALRAQVAELEAEVEDLMATMDLMW